MVTDTDSSATCCSKFEVPSLKTSTENEGPSENIDFTENPSEDSKEKKFKKTLPSTFMKQPGGTPEP